MSVPSKTTALSISKVTKNFSGNRAVDGINIEVYTGEIFGFLGPNGAGKSTTIRLLLDILRADSGDITILGRPSRDVTATHREIGFLSGDMVLDTDITGRQYLQLVNNLYGGSYADRVTALAGTLEAKLDVKIGMYSRGNRQKIGLIAALLHEPRLLILDGPTSGFDPLVQEKFALLLREYVGKGGTVSMSSHVLAEVQHLCDRVAFIKAGKIIRTVSVAKLVDSFKTVDGYLRQQVYVLRLPLLMIILAISTLVGLTAGDEQKGLLETQLSLPLSRTTLLLQKLGAGLTIITVASLGAIAGITIGTSLLGESFHLARVLGYTANCVAVATVYGLIPFTIAALTGWRAVALGIGSAFAFVSYLLNSMAPSVASLQTIDKLTFFHYYQNDSFSLFNIIVLLIAAVLLITISLIGFNRRDIRTN